MGKLLAELMGIVDPAIFRKATYVYDFPPGKYYFKFDRWSVKDGALCLFFAQAGEDVERLRICKKFILSINAHVYHLKNFLFDVLGVNVWFNNIEDIEKFVTMLLDAGSWLVERKKDKDGFYDDQFTIIPNEEKKDDETK